MALKLFALTQEFYRRLAREYLHPTQTMGTLAKRYQSSPSTISKILYDGIVNSYIDDIIATAIVNKVIDSTRKFEKHKTRTRWQHALQLRQKLIVEQTIATLESKLEELNFQLDTYDDVFGSEGPGKENIILEIQDIELTIYTLKHSESEV